MDSSRTVSRRGVGTLPRRALGLFLSLVLAFGTLGLTAPLASAAGDDLPSVVIEKSVIDPTKEYKKGDTVQFKLAVRCSSLQIHCKTVEIKDVLNPNLQWLSDSAATGIPVVKSHSGNSLQWNVGTASDNMDDLDEWFQAGQTFNITINAKVISLPADGSLTIPNKATAEVPGVPLVTSNEVSVKLKAAAPAVFDWGLRKVRSDGSANPVVGSEVTYDVRFTRPYGSGGLANETGVDISSVVLKDIIPAGATFVSATSTSPSSTGTYDSGTNTISFPSTSISSELGPNGMYCGSDPCISYFSAQIKVKYEAANGFKAGDTVINKASADPVYADGSTHPPLTAEAPVTLADAKPSVSGGKSNDSTYAAPTPGQTAGWTILTRNNGNVALGTATVVDTIPAGLDPSTLQINTKHYLTPKNVAPRTATFEYFDGTDWVSLGSMGAGETKDLPAIAKKVRMTATNVVINEYFGFGLTGKVAADVAPGTIIKNCAAVDGDTGSLPDMCAQYTVPAKPTVSIYPLKSNNATVPSALVPGDEFTWFLRWRAFSIDPIAKATIVETLPAGFELVTEEAPCLYLASFGGTITECAANATTPAYTAEPQADGTTKITFKDAALPTVVPNTQNAQSANEYRIHLKVRVKDGTAAGQYTNKYEVQYPDNQLSCNSQLPAGKCGAIDTVGVINNAAVGIQKWDKGTEPNVLSSTGKASAKCPDWNGYTRYPCVAQTLPGGDFDYKLRIANQGNVSMTKEVVYDILPFVGDKGVSEDLWTKNRGTEWRPVLTGPITLDAAATTAVGHNYKVEYSLSSNPCRPELKSTGGDGDFTGGTCVNDWSTTVADWSAVRAFRVSMYADGTEWLPGKMLVVNIPMKAPADALYSTLDPVNLSPAWNSVAQRSFEFSDQTNSGRLVSEPPVVGIIIPAPYVSIGDYVWYDEDYDGQQDANETPAAGIKVTLKDSTGKVVGTTTTNPQGYYWFQNLTEKANYTLEFEKPAGYSWTSKDTGADTSDSDVDPATSKITFTAPTWVSGTSHNYGAANITDNPTLDGGLVKPIPQVSVGDYVWKDLDNDGIQEAGEPGIPGVVLTIKDETGAAVTNVLGNPVGPVTTDANGFYSFPLLPVGHTYTVTIDQAASATALAGLAPTKANQGSDDSVDSSTGSATSDPMTVDGQKDPTLDFGFYEAPVSIGDYVWYDNNRDGLQTAGEPFAPNVTVTLKDAKGNVVGTTTTDPAGYYWFTNLASDTDYTLTFTAPSGYSWTTQNSSGVTDNNTTSDTNDSDVNPADGTVPFKTPATGSNQGAANVTDNPTLDGGLVKFNLTLAKKLDTQGPFVPGKKVTFTLTPHNDGPSTALKGWTVTEIIPAGLTLDKMSGDGYTCVGNVCTADAALAGNTDGGPITVEATIADGFTGKAHNVAYVSPGPNEIVETNPLVVPETGTDTSKTDTDNDAQADLEVTAVSIGDYVWWDNDRDGQQDATEPLISGATVNLLDKDGNFIRSTTTNAQGYYVFNNLLPSTAYIVEFVKPDSGSSFTAATQPGGTASDSNPDVTTGRAPVTTPASGSNLTENGKADDPTIDAGFVKLNLTLAKSLDTKGPFAPGDTVVFTLTPHNDGPSTALAGWKVTEVVPAQLTLVSMTGDSDAYDCSGVVCTSKVPLAGNADGKPITVTATINKPGTVGAIHNVAYVSPATADVPETNVLDIPGTDTDTSTTRTDNDAQASLSIPPVSIGDYVWYDKNRDGQQTDGELPVAGVVVNLYGPDGVFVKSTTTSDAGYYAFNGLLPETNYSVEFVKPAGTTFTSQNVGADVSDSDADVTTGKAAVKTPSDGNNLTDPGKADDPTIDAGLVTQINLVLAKSLDTQGPFIPKQEVTFTLSPKNEGPMDALAGWSVTEVLPEQLTLVSMTGDGYTCDNATATCTAAGQLAAGATGKPITVKATINRNALGPIHNVAYVSPAGNELVETNPLVVPGTSTDTSTTGTDNDAQADLKVDPVSIGDYVWWDANRDGQQNAEPVVAGVTVNLYDEFGIKVGATTTDENGYYAFKDLQAGMPYTVEFIRPEGSQFTTQTVGPVASDSNPDVVNGFAPVTAPTSGSNLTDPGKADDPTIDAGLVKFNLVLAKGLDTQGPFVPNQTVTFTLTPHNDGPVAALAGWSVTEVVPAQLTLVSMAGDGYTCTGVTCVAKDALASGADGKPITVTATINADALGPIHNVAYVSPAAGDVPETNVLVVPTTDTDTATTGTDNDAQANLKVDPVSIGDFVWYDKNRDGQQTAGEAVVPNVTVNLYAADGTTLKGTTTTDANGYYAFANLQPNTTYVVEFVKPDGTTFTTALTGPTASDSNADVVTGRTTVTTPMTGSNLVAPDKADVPTIDAGLVSQINLVLVKALLDDGPFVQGQEVHFVLVPFNDGPMDALAGWSVTEVLPEGLTLVSMEGGDDYTCVDDTCVSKVQLAVGDEGAEILVTATINDKALGLVHNVAFISPSEDEVVETNPLVVPTTDTDTEATETDNDAQDVLELLPPAIELTKLATLSDFNNNGRADAGETIVYSFVVTNTGGVRLAPVTISDAKLGLTGAPCVDSLAVAEEATCSTTKSYTVTDADVAAKTDIANTATATGQVPGTPDKVTDDDTRLVPIGVPVLPQTGGDLPLWMIGGLPLVGVAGLVLMGVAWRGRRTSLVNSTDE